MILLLAFAFLAGLVTILTPCIWPLLPIILSSSAAGQSKKRPLGITLGIIISFAVVTLTISTLVRLFHFDPNILRLIAVVVIGFLGLSFLIPRLSEILEQLISRLTAILNVNNLSRAGGFGGGFVTGLALGAVWSPCAGPILAAISTLAATGQVTLNVITITLAYVAGVGVPLFVFSYGGQLIFARVHFLSSQTATIQKIFGVIMILTAIAIYTNYDVYLQSQLLNYFPSLNSLSTAFESNSAVSQQLSVLKGNQLSTPSVSGNGLLNTNYPAAEFTGVTHWLNTDNNSSTSLSNLRGKVILVDFWTYTCINCIRTLPHVTSWYQKYKDQGFVVIGIHTPEFEFEKDTNNVAAAIKQFGITYPVGQDNNYAVWNAYNNQYWPAEYLIDAKGFVRRTHFGEGEYDQTEQAIQQLLTEAGQKVDTSIVNMPDQTPAGAISPETYFGTSRMQYYYPGGSVANGTRNFTLSDNPPLNTFSYGGTWTISNEFATSGKSSVVVYNFSADKVFLVARPNAIGKSGQVKIFLDGKLVTPEVSGTDVQQGIVMISSDRLYNLVDLKNNPGVHILRLEFSPGIDIFTFTFG